MMTELEIAEYQLIKALLKSKDDEIKRLRGVVRDQQAVNKAEANRRVIEW